jgi:hypothetical protein
VPAVIAETDEDPRLIALAMNRIRGETDLAVAGMMIEELIEAGIDQDMLSISGFSERELSDLLEAMNSSDEPNLDDLGSATMPDDPSAPVKKPFLLELTFRKKEDLQAVKKALRKAVGKGGDLADGMLRLIAAE